MLLSLHFVFLTVQKLVQRRGFPSLWDGLQLSKGSSCCGRVGGSHPLGTFQAAQLPGLHWWNVTSTRFVAQTPCHMHRMAPPASPFPSQDRLSSTILISTRMRRMTSLTDTLGWLSTSKEDSTWALSNFAWNNGSWQSWFFLLQNLVTGSSNPFLLTSFCRISVRASWDPTTWAAFPGRRLSPSCLTMPTSAGRTTATPRGTTTDPSTSQQRCILVWFETPVELFRWPEMSRKEEGES